MFKLYEVAETERNDANGRLGIQAEYWAIVCDRNKMVNEGQRKQLSRPCLTGRNANVSGGLVDGEREPDQQRQFPGVSHRN